MVPVEVLVNTKPAGLEEKVPPVAPVMVGVGLAPDLQYAFDA